jgi:hypothetical protein
VRVAEVVEVENLGGLLGLVRVLVMISPQEVQTSLPGAVPRFGKPITPLSNKEDIVPLSKATVADTTLQLGMALNSTALRLVIRKPPAILNSPRVTITLSIIKANTPNSRSALLPFSAVSGFTR